MSKQPIGGKDDIITFHVLNRERLAQFKLDKPYLMILINDPMQPALVQPNAPVGTAILTTQFSDVLSQGYKAPIITFDQVKAENIVKTFKQHIKNVNNVAIACPSGNARSAAVAAALWDLYTQFSPDPKSLCNPFFVGYTPNGLVYQQLMVAANKNGMFTMKPM